MSTVINEENEIGADIGQLFMHHSCDTRHVLYLHSHYLLHCL